MSYLSYQEYQDMGGTLDEATFNDVSYEAQSQIDWWTFSRLQTETELPDAVKQCMYHLIKLIQDYRIATAVGTQEDGTAVSASVASQSNDGVSISYNIMSASEAVEVIQDQLKNAVQRYLQGVKNSLGQKVLYRGLYPGE